MWASRIIPKRIVHGRNTAVLEIGYIGDRALFRLSEIALKAECVVVKNTFEFDSMPECTAKIQPSQPLVLVLSGSIVLSKQIPASIDVSDQNIVLRSLPGVDLDKNYVQLFSLNENTWYLSLTKKSKVDELIESLSKKVIQVAEIFIGPGILTSLDSTFDKAFSINTGFYNATVDNGKITSISPFRSEQLVYDSNVGETNLTGAQIPGFAAGVSYFSPCPSLIWQSETLVAKKQNYEQARVFKFMMTASIAAALVLALTNAFIYSHLYKKNEELTSLLKNHEIQFERLTAKTKNNLAMQAVMAGADLDENTHFTFFSDQIASTVPEQITLAELQMCPSINKEVDADTIPIFEKQLVTIKGLCTQSFILNEWIKRLRQFAFVKEVGLQEFSLHNNGERPNFHIRMQIR